MTSPHPKVQLLCLYCGLAAVVLLGVGILTAGFLPPPSPSRSPASIQRLFSDHADRIRIGMTVLVVAGALTGPFVGLLFQQMTRIPRSAPLAHVQLGMGMIGITLFVFPSLTLEAVAFRPGRSPELMQLADDMAWLPFVGVFALAVVQQLAVAVAIFVDEAETVFPRWVAYVNIWCALLLLPDVLIYFFKSGPFAWNGAFCFWLPIGAFSAWFIVMFVALKRSLLPRGPA